jgi:hypothetical protein
MNNITILFLLFLLLNDIGLTQHNLHSQEGKSEIKTLSKEQINSYLNGEGMGLAKPAELNHYPGPKHVLEFSNELKLTEDQINQTNRLIDEVKINAVSLGYQIIEKEKELDSLFVNNIVEEKTIRSLLLKLAELNGELRFVHINAHIKQEKILEHNQIELYDKLRGYK